MVGESYVVYGSAKPAGSKRAFRYRAKSGGHKIAITDANPNSRDWKTIVSQAVGDARGGQSLLSGPLSLSLVFVVARPKGHFGKRGLLPSAPSHPAKRPDLLKLARAVEDALTGVVWRDDSQIVTEVLNKVYGNPERVEISIQGVVE